VKDKLKSDSVAALKNHDARLVGVLRYLISLLDKRELQLPPGKMSEAEEVAVLRKELKNKEESREMFAKGGRDDLVAEVDFEIEVVKKYLPSEMSDEELENIVKESIDGGDTDFGTVMRKVMAKVGGRAGGERIAKMVRGKIK